MTKQSHFFADSGDLKKALRISERACSVKYVKLGLSERPDIPVLLSLCDWELLGSSENGRSAGFFLVLPREAEVRITQLRMNDGTIQYQAKAQDHPVCFVLYPSGIYGASGPEVILTVGKLGTAATDDGTTSLFKQYRKPFLKSMKAVGREYWVGENAERLKLAGAKLMWQWTAFFNSAWAPLKFTFDSLDGSVKSIERSAWVYERKTPGVFVFDKRNSIRATANGYRWQDRRGNCIESGPQMVGPVDGLSLLDSPSVASE